MFNVGGGEIIVILLLALLLLGPERLPEMARKVSRVLAEVRRMTSGFEEEIRSAIDIDLRDPLKPDAVHSSEPGPTLTGPVGDPGSPVPTRSSGAAFVADLGETSDGADRAPAS